MCLQLELLDGSVIAHEPTTPQAHRQVPPSVALVDGSRVAEAQPGSWEARTWPLCRESLTAWAPTVSSSCRSSSSSSYSVWCACWAQPFATSAPGLGSTVCHICAGTGLNRLPHLRRDWARPCHICTETGLTGAQCVGQRRVVGAAPMLLLAQAAEPFRQGVQCPLRVR